ncbi:MAG: Peptidyl-tRNA hydrolase [Steroidobacteraceae bacterium]|nr:Peptidyl-tRNA hydrolase [Steroidobacteraceae bacterium]
MAGFPLKLVVGLGNPGDEYARTRHNAGFWFIDELAARHGGSLRADRRHHGDLARVQIGGADVILLKPMQYMNRSAGPVGSVADFYKIEPAAILVAHDELDLPVGTVRLKEGGGHGGHNGLRDLIPRIGEGFWRLRIGIGHPGEKSEVVDYVLTRAPAAQDSAIRDAVKAAAGIVPLLLAEGPQRAMNKLHTKPAESE